MRYTTIIGLFVGLGLPAAALAQASAETRAEVEAAVRAYIVAHNRGDAGAVAAMFSTQAGVTSVGNGAIVRGWDGIREHGTMLDTLMARQGRLKVTLGSVDVTELGKGYALAIAPYTLTGGAQGTDVRGHGAMTLVLRKVGNDWKIVHDHTSAVLQATPPAAMAAAAPAAAPVAAAAPTSVTPSASVPQAAASTAPPGGTTIPIVSGAALELSPQQVAHYDFYIPAEVCTVTGRMEGLSGPTGDFEVLVLDDANYRNWSAGLQAKAYGSTGRVTAANINAPIPGPGAFHLVISNAFSPAAGKALQVWAQVQCP